MPVRVLSVEERTVLQNKLKVVALLAAASSLSGQTQVDLKTQAKAIDFTLAPETRPVKTGTALPARCAVGDLLFLTNAAAGANLYGCVAVNSWSLESGGGGGGSLTVDSSSIFVGSRSVANFIAGPGILNLISDTGTQINVQQNADTSFLLTRAQAQAGSDTTLSCATGSSTAYGCSPNGNALMAYTDQQRFGWKPDRSCGAAPSLNISTLGAKPLYRSDGTAIQAGDCAAGTQVTIWYDAGANGGAGGFKLTNPVPALQVPPFTFKAVTFSATPAFPYGYGATTFELTLTGNVTASAVSGAALGQSATFIICQDSTGSRTFAWPPGFRGAMTIGMMASACSVQTFVYDGASYYATAPGLTNQ